MTMGHEGIDSEKDEDIKCRAREDLKKKTNIWHAVCKNTASRVRNDKMKAGHRAQLKCCWKMCRVRAREKLSWREVFLYWK